jgi:hypothetical protein
MIMRINFAFMFLLLNLVLALRLLRADQCSSYFAFALNRSRMQPPRSPALDLGSFTHRFNLGLPINWVDGGVTGKDSPEQQKESERSQA